MPAIARFAIALALLVAAAIVVPAAQQTLPQAPVFRGGTIIVPLDVTVLDKSGKPVTDLTQADFTVFEGDVPQAIRSFFPQRFTPQPPPPATGSPLVRSARTDRVAPETRRTFLIVLGFGRIQVPARGIDGALTFVREHLLPQDLVAVLAMNRATGFTMDHEHIAQMLERYRSLYEALVFDIQEFQLRHPRTPLPPSFQTRIDALFPGQPPRSATEMLLDMNRVQPIAEKAWNRQETLADIQSYDDPSNTKFSDAEKQNATLSDLVVTVDRMKVFAGIEYLRYLDGEKHLLYLGEEGLGLSTVEDDNRMAARANDARIAMDLTHTQGVSHFPGSSFASIASSERVAELTGGFFTGVTYADKALARVDAAARFSYLLGYAPSNPKLDGTLRQVKVLVNRPDVTVLFHHGYYALEDLPPVDMKEMLVTARLASASGFEWEAHDIKLAVTAAPTLHLGGASQMRVDVTVDATRLSFAPSSTERVGGLDIEIFCGDAKQRVVGDSRQRVELRADEATWQRFLKDGVPFTTRVPVTDVVTYVKVVVYDYGADLLGTYAIKIGK